MQFEPGMSIKYDRASKRLTILFRGIKLEHVIAFKNNDEAIEFGKKVCRTLGWRG